MIRDDEVWIEPRSLARDAGRHLDLPDREQYLGARHPSLSDRSRSTETLSAEEVSMSFRRGSVLLASLLCCPGHVGAAPCAAGALDEIRPAVERVCPCLGAATASAYQRCVKKATKALQSQLVSLTNPCRKAMIRVAEDSTCGRPG